METEQVSLQINEGLSEEVKERKPSSFAKKTGINVTGVDDPLLEGLVHSQKFIVSQHRNRFYMPLKKKAPPLKEVPIAKRGRRGRPAKYKTITLESTTDPREDVQ